MNPSDLNADVIVVGAGPAGASTAYHLATLGIDVVVMEKATFPRDKICGDGLTPSAVREIVAMGIDPLTTGWIKNRGLTVIGGGHRIQMPWPQLSSVPAYGMACARTTLDQTLIERAVAAGARLYQGITVTGPVRDKRGRIVGVTAKIRDEQRRVTEVSATAKIVIDCGGVAARLATAAGIEKAQNRPMAVAARTYFRSPRADEEWMESHLELWSGKPGESELLPGYGWIFPLGNGLVNVGLGSISSGAKSTKLPYKQIFQEWVANLPQEWGFTPENQEGPLRSAALPMCFNRTPHYANGLALVGDAGGMVSPFNGEGIAPAMMAGRICAFTVAQALARPTTAQFDKAMSAYPAAIKAEWGSYYNFGRVFVRLIENPKIMQLCTRYGLPRPHLMKLVHKLLSDSYEREGGDIYDHLIQVLTKVVPSV